MLTNTIIESGGSVVNQGFFLGWLEEILLFAHNSVRYCHRLPARDTAVKNAFVSECQTEKKLPKKKKKVGETWTHVCQARALQKLPP